MKIKQLTIALMALGLSGAAVAGSFTAPAAAEAAPQPKWFLGGDAIWGQTGNDNSIYATGPAGVNQTQFSADRDNEWAFKIWAGYDAGNGASYWVDWVRDHNDGKTSATPVGTGFQPQGGTATFTQIAALQSSKFDQVTLQAGHTFKNTNGTSVKVHGGAQGVFLDSTNNYAFVPSTVLAFASQSSEFDGGGVVAGLDIEHMFGSSFSVFSRNQVGLVYGRQDSKYVAVNGAGAVVSSLSTENKNTVLPTFNADLGAAYTMQLASMDLRLEAGVRGTVVVDGVQGYTEAETGVPTSDDRFNWSEASIFFGGQVAFSNLGGLIS